MVAQVAALDHPGVFAALTLVGTRPVAPGPVDDDLAEHDAATMTALFSRPMRARSDRTAAAAYAADSAALLGDDPEQARRTASDVDGYADNPWLLSALAAGALGDEPVEPAGPRLVRVDGLAAASRLPTVTGTAPSRPRVDVYRQWLLAADVDSCPANRSGRALGSPAR